MKKAFYSASVVVFLIVFSYSNAVAASDSLSYPSKHGSNFSVNLGGPGCFASFAYSKYITSKVENEIGLGLYGAFIGCKYHWWIGPSMDEEYLSPYIGVFYSNSLLLFDATIPQFILPPVNSVYVPFGLQFYGREHFNIAFEIAAVKVFNYVNDNKYGLFPWLGIKAGYYF